MGISGEEYRYLDGCRRNFKRVVFETIKAAKDVGLLTVFNPKTGEYWESDFIYNISLNGDCTQITVEEVPDD